MHTCGKVDVAVQVFGKPYQTAVTILSLLKHSGKWIDNIYFVTERKQPAGTDFSFLMTLLKPRITLFTPRFFLGVFPVKYFRPLFGLKSFRHSIRYQLAWEMTDKDFLFITHNDVLYKDDIIGSFLDNIGSHAGIGQVGQCWNCSAHLAEKCSSDKYLAYRPSPTEYSELSSANPARTKLYRRFPRNNIWPLPECRLNEWACMINIKRARPLTIPFGKIPPFGAMYLDTGTEWFYGIHQEGETVRHIDIADYCTHAWSVPERSGHILLSDPSRYQEAEESAKQLLESEYTDLLAS